MVGRSGGLWFLGFIDQAPEDLKTEPAFCVSPRDEEVAGGCSIYRVGVGVDVKIGFLHCR